ncbi:MAG: anthranilate phosphoribosyltransferase [Lewinellaceae bacterium]|nr:anthranilate phosphoribosyltransferase [Saprospiraceae bacterium]MCB9311896.1 anthranilate phosphoribosyltransferase [Lewinellaceae bacterium]HRW74468.1 anthranilate phosphoribosyltransferase [Saprospiraceae bacterium]
MRQLLDKLFLHQSLDREEAREVMGGIADQRFPDAQIAAFLAIYRMRPVTVVELSGFRDALIDRAVSLQLDRQDLLDIVGTGGDGKKTFNISTTSAFVAAGAGVPIIKHGSFGVSSPVGSSNVLQALGVPFTVDSDIINRQLEHAGISFLHAPICHPAMKAVVPVRKALAIPTLFNALGPLLNPARPRYSVLGTATLEQARTYHYVLQDAGQEYAVVHALDGYDEISLTGTTQVFRQGTQAQLPPSAFGLKPVRPESLVGPDQPDQAAKVLLAILEGKAPREQEDVVCANAALAINLHRPDTSLPDAVDLARESIHRGNARRSLHLLLHPTATPIRVG